MRRHALTLLTLSALAITAFADTKSDLQKAYNTMGSLIKAKNFDKLGAFFTPDFKVVDKGQTFTKDSALSMMKQQLATTTIVQLSSQVSGVKAAGADTNCVSNEVMVLKMKQGGKDSTIKLVSSSLDTWTKSGGKWLLKKSVAQKEQMWVNGKLFNPAGAGAGK